MAVDQKREDEESMGVWSWGATEGFPVYGLDAGVVAPDLETPWVFADDIVLEAPAVQQFPAPPPVYDAPPARPSIEERGNSAPLGAPDALGPALTPEERLARVSSGAGPDLPRGRY